MLAFLHWTVNTDAINNLYFCIFLIVKSPIGNISPGDKHTIIWNSILTLQHQSNQLDEISLNCRYLLWRFFAGESVFATGFDSILKSRWVWGTLHTFCISLIWMLFQRVCLWQQLFHLLSSWLCKSPLPICGWTHIKFSWNVCLRGKAFFIYCFVVGKTPSSAVKWEWKTRSASLSTKHTNIEISSATVNSKGISNKTIWMNREHQQEKTNKLSQLLKEWRIWSICCMPQ